MDAALRSIEAKALFIASRQDQILPPEHVEAAVQAIRDARAVWIDSGAGHLMCCTADPNATRDLSKAIRQFLSELDMTGGSR